MPRLLSFTWIATVLVAVSCGGRTDLGSTQPVLGPDATIDGVVLHWCGPADQAALWFRIDPAETMCVLQKGIVKIAGVGFMFYGSALPGQPGQYAIGDGSSTSTSQGYWCTGQDCVGATSGTLTITEMTKSFVVGAYDLVLPGGTTQTGTFTAITCDNPLTCG
jgi:hypothetical protein